MEQYQLKGLYDQGSYEEIRAIYQNPEERDAFTEWDWSFAMNALYKLKRYSDCLDAYKMFHKKYPDSSRLDDKMSWSLYYTHLRNAEILPDNAETFRKQAEYVLQHCSSTQYSPRWMVTKLLIKAMREGKLGQNVDHQSIARYLDQIDPMTLSTTEGSTEQNGKQIKLASDRESWYAEKSKVQLDLGQYEACIDTAGEALHVITSFHHHHDSWFAYRRAKAQIALGRTDQAQKEIEAILNRGFSHWCFYQIPFEIEKDHQNDEAALLDGVKCALADPSHEMRVTFYDEFAEFLYTMNRQREADLHRQLVILLRNENGWPLREKQLAWVIPEDIREMDKRAVLRELAAFWCSVNDSGRTFYEGAVTKLLPSGQDGFITANGDSYYFSMRDVRGHNAEMGSKVRFALENRLDRKKNVMKPAAVDIQIIK